MEASRAGPRSMSHLALCALRNGDAMKPWRASEQVRDTIRSEFEKTIAVTVGGQR